ncbi:DUF4365 and DUF1817 domain-containing protein [Listeria booriae]|uniref:DUF4365 and DUF1817 domain-containing protein n=1 Tax=Listeria booriae TaxID=1552123 RepID=UPI001623491F|nr:DUF4365 and DUF1817 domain-containing protein [Listeria booriae]MBC1649260.1 DUF4365 and DUF1817 domain-containing protein [Listeria booriae]
MFPKRNLSAQKGVEGQAFFQLFVVSKLKCIYHSVNQENDSGIDGYIELVVDGNTSGKLIAVQIKHGNSYFKSKTKFGYKFTGEYKHLNYYMNQQIPVFIIILDDEFEKQLWVEFDIKKIASSGSNNWNIEISEENSLTKNFHETIFNKVSPIVNFDETIRWNLALNSILQKSSFSIITIPKDDINTISFDTISEFIDRLSGNGDLLVKSANTLDIFFPEYDEDPREIFQIPEIMKWLKQSIDNGIPWFYFLNTMGKSSGLHLLVTAYCSITNVDFNGKGFVINYSPEELGFFIEKNFDSLNRFMDTHHLDIELNKDISERISNYFLEHLT